MPFTYMLRCADGSLYTGWTVDLEARLAAHAAGSAKYTRARRPLSLAWCEEQPDRSAAMRREAEIKKLSKTEKEAMAAAWKGANEHE